MRTSDKYGPQKLVGAIHPFPIIDCSPSTLVALNNLPIDSLNFISTKNALLINECNFLLTFFLCRRQPTIWCWIIYIFHKTFPCVLRKNNTKILQMQNIKFFGLAICPCVWWCWWLWGGSM